MTTQSFTKWQQALALGGALLWTPIVGLAATGHAPLGVIELMFLFAPLVIVPLGLALAKAVKPVHHCKWESSLLFFHPFAAAATLISFWHSPGRIAGLLALPWMLFCGLEALAGTLTLMQQKKHNLVAWAINIGRLDLAIAGGWLVISRLGLRPIGIQEPIILLTAVHFHYTGFATALLAGTVLATAQRQNRNIRFLKILVASIIVIPFVVAAGFVWSAALKMAAAVLLSACLVCLAGAQLWIAPSVAPQAARIYIRLSALSVGVAMILASIYAIGDWLKQDWLLIPRMGSTHGVLNGLGFALLGLLGWLIHGSTSPSS